MTQSISCENEIKIKRLERQATRYEEYIQYLYKIIEGLQVNAEVNKNEIHDLRTQLSELSHQLKRIEKISNEKELFISYRESQLLEFEDVIHSLKERISFLAQEKRKESNIMTNVHTEPFPNDITDDNCPLTRLDNSELLGEVRKLSSQLKDAVVNSHRRERNRNLASRKYERIHSAVTMLYNRQVDEIIEKDRQITHLQEVLDMRNDEFAVFKNRVDTALDKWQADVFNIRRLNRLVAILRIQNHWRQIRLMNHPIIPPQPQPQASDQVWLLFH
jgi:chromosome segregation ATPase